MGSVFEIRPDLRDRFEAGWQVAPSSDVRQWQRYGEQIDELIRAVNRTDEAQVRKSPVLILTAAGIVFMFSLVAAAWLYFQYVVAR